MPDNQSSNVYVLLLSVPDPNSTEWTFGVFPWLETPMLGDYSYNGNTNYPSQTKNPMTKKDFTALTTALSRGYHQVQDPIERRGYNHAIHACMQFMSHAYPRFDAVRFAATIYQTQKHSK
jgi:hypothetical protein